MTERPRETVAGIHAQVSQPLARREASILSPLRYPGGKRRLAGYVAEALRINSLRPKLFVEPFAGGASVALQLLNDDLVDFIALGEKDPLVASFWKVVFNDPDWLIHQLGTIQVTLDNWRHFRNQSLNSDRDQALACLFLNRTSFSGILAPGAGPIGGMSQVSRYAINCRFPVETLVKRIRQAAALRGRVLFVNTADGIDTIRKVEALSFQTGEVFYYLDPPFYKKAERLYRFYFQQKDHTTLHGTLAGVKHPWLLSYDPAKAVIAMYSENGAGPKEIDLLYSAATGGSSVKARELIITNLRRLPRETRLWRSSVEWRKSSAGEHVERGDQRMTPGRLP